MASRVTDEFLTLFLRKMFVSVEAEPRGTQGRLGDLCLCCLLAKDEYIPPERGEGLLCQKGLVCCAGRNKTMM